MERSGLVDRKLVGPCRQKFAAIAENDHLEMEFDGVAISREDRTQVELGNRAGIEIEHPGQLLRRHVVRPGEQEVVVLGKFPPVHVVVRFLRHLEVKDIRRSRISHPHYRSAAIRF